MMSALPSSTPDLLAPQAVDITAVDGYRLRGTFWPAPEAGSAPQAGHSQASRAALINCATGVAARYYARYATYLQAQGFAVLTYDYRGIGASRPVGSLRGLQATKADWGAKDCDAAIRWLHARLPEAELLGVGHSIGGFCFGLAASNHLLSRLLLVGAQYAYWRDYAPGRRLGLWLRWHVLMPLLTALYGYFPGRRLRWLEDLPAGVAYEWAFRFWPEFDRRYHRFPHHLPAATVAQLRAAFTGFRGEVLAYSLSDDEYGTVAAIERLLRHFTHSRRTHLRLDPANLGEKQVGHFAFFHDRFRTRLWPETAIWLATGTIARSPHSSFPPLR